MRDLIYFPALTVLESYEPKMIKLLLIFFAFIGHLKTWLTEESEHYTTTYIEMPGKNPLIILLESARQISRVQNKSEKGNPEC